MCIRFHITWKVKLKQISMSFCSFNQIFLKVFFWDRMLPLLSWSDLEAGALDYGDLDESKIKELQEIARQRALEELEKLGKKKKKKKLKKLKKKALKKRMRQLKVSSRWSVLFQGFTCSVLFVSYFIKIYLPPTLLGWSKSRSLRFRSLISRICYY